MNTITFDTRKFAKDLESAGMPPAQAEAFVRAQQEILHQALDTSPATKSAIAIPDHTIAKLSWMISVLVALAIANVAKQFF